MSVKLKNLLLEELENEQITVEDFEAVLNDVLPSSFHREVREVKSFGTYIAIVFSVSTYPINSVRGQYPGIVSLAYWPDRKLLKPQVFGGEGGQRIYRRVDPNNPAEKYSALGSDKVPFRTPQPNKKSIMSALRKFAENYIMVLQDINRRGLWRDEYGKLEI